MSETSLAARLPAEPGGSLSADNLTTLEHLCRAIELAEGFALLFARCNLSSQRDDLLARLTVLLERQGISSHRLDVRPATGSEPGLLADLQAACAVAGGRSLVHICGIEQAMPYGDPHPPLLGQLNLARDRFRALPCPVVFWLRDEALTRLAQGAPDFWAWRSGVFEFQPEPELTRALYRQTQEDTSRWRNLPAEQKEARIATLESLLEDYKALGDGPIERRAQAGLLLELADLYQAVYRWSAAVWSLKEALQLAHGLDDQAIQAQALQKRGYIAYFHEDDYDQALDAYSQALALFRQVGDRLGEANTRKAIGDVQQFRDERDAALDSYSQALALFRQVGSSLGEANTLQAIGDVQQFRKENDAALDAYSQALALFRQVGDRLGEANTLAAQGRVYILDQPEKANELLGQAIAIYQHIGDRYSAPAQIGNFGWALLRLGEKERARPYLLRAADLFEQIGLLDYADRHRQHAK